MTNDDMQLVQEYAASDSQPAFETLVSRYVGLVHSSALRQLRDPHLAEEVTQAVFIILARKAGSLGPKTILPGWLLRTTRYTAANLVRTSNTRQRYEQEAFMESTGEENSAPGVWRELSPWLDEALERLAQKDRDLLVLRYFENKSLQEVASVAGIEERAAQKRVSRGLEKLRRFFSRRGITLSAAAIAGALSANSVQAAPAALTKTIIFSAAAKGAAASSSTLTLVKGALKLMAWAKAKSVIVTGIAVILTTGITAVVATKAYAAKTSEAVIVNNFHTAPGTYRYTLNGTVTELTVGTNELKLTSRSGQSTASASAGRGWEPANEWFVHVGDDLHFWAYDGKQGLWSLTATPLAVNIHTLNFPEEQPPAAVLNRLPKEMKDRLKK